MGNSLEYWIIRGELRKVNPDRDRIKSLKESAKKRFKFFKKSAKDFPSFMLEGYYEAVRELLDSLLLEKGYKAESHISAIFSSHSLKIISKDEELVLNSARELRNKFKYYGEDVQTDTAKLLIGKLEQIFLRLYS